MSNNNQLKSTIESAKNICIQNSNAAKDDFGATNSKVLSIEKEINTVFQKFDTPNFWDQVISANSTELMSEILKIGAIDMSSVDNYVSVTQTFLTFLTDKVLATPLANLGTDAPPVMNVLTADNLRKAGFKIDGRKKFFKNKGVDLDGNTKFKGIEKSYRESAATCRKLLLSNKVTATQRDADSINSSADAISAEENFDFFLILFEGFAEAIKKRIPAVIPTP